MLRFNANLFRLAFSCSSSEETRYYLKGVFVEPHALGGVTMTSTDGHRLLCIRDENGQADESVIINLGAAIKECKSKRSERRDVVIYTGENNAHIMLTTIDDKGDLTDSPIATAYGVRVDGTYPDYRRVVPQSFAAKGAPGFSGTYLATFSNIAGELAAHIGRKPTKNEKNGANYLRVLCEDCNNPEGSPALILFPATDIAFGILMPVRIKGEQTDVPTWFRLPAPTAQAAE